MDSRRSIAAPAGRRPARGHRLRSVLAFAAVGFALASPGAERALGAGPPASGGKKRADANAAEVYKDAWQLLGEDRVPLGLSSEEWNTLVEITAGGSLMPADVDRARMLMDRISPLREKVLALGSLRKSDFGLDRSKGLMLDLPHLAKMRLTARLLLAEAALAQSDGNWERSLAALGSIAAVGSHAGQDKVLISSLVGGAVGSFSLRGVDSVLDSGQLDQAKAQQLLDALRPLGGDDPFRFSASVEGEFELLSTSIRGKSPRDVAALLGEGADGEHAESLRALEAATPQEMQRDLRRADALYRKAADAFAKGDDPAAARAAMAEIEREAAKSPLLLLLMPSMAKCLEAKLLTEAAIAERMEKLRLLAEGKKSAMELANGAEWLRRAAAIARGLAEPEQAAVEVVRLGGNDVTGELRESAARVHQTSGASIREAVAFGLACGRVDFDNRNERDTGVSLQWLPGLRGACRVLLSRAMVAPPDEAAALVAMVADVSRHLALDPSVTRSVVAMQLAEEAIPAVTRLSGADAPSTEAVERLQRALQALAAANGFGHSKAADADRDRLAASWGGIVDPEKRKVLRRKSADFVFFVAVALAAPDPGASRAEVEAAKAAAAGGGAEAPRKRFDPGPLINFDDVLPPEAVAQAVAQRGALEKCPFFSSWQPLAEDDAKAGAPFKGVTPVMVRDSGQDAGRAAEVAGRLSDAAAKVMPKPAAGPEAVPAAKEPSRVSG